MFSWIKFLSQPNNNKSKLSQFISHTKTLDSLLPEDSCIELDLELCTCHIRSICSDQLIFQTSDTICSNQFLFQTSDTVPICTRLIHMSYSDQLIFQTSDIAIWTSFESSLIGNLHLCESIVPLESGYLLR